MKMTSIIVLGYKELDKFKKMFKTLMANTQQKETPFEIVLVNNSELPECKFKNHNPLSFFGKRQSEAFKNNINCSIIEMNGNKGASKGYNEGVKYSSGHYLCFFNSDYYMQKDWLKSMIECFEHQPNIGICSCCTNETGNVDERCANITDLKEEFKESECAIAQMFTTRKIFDEVKGFDEDYIFSFLDLDFNERIKSKGYKVFVNQKCFGYHDYNSTNKDCAGHRELFRKKWGDEIARRYKWA